jgi:molecular chaperone GrpE
MDLFRIKQQLMKRMHTQTEDAARTAAGAEAPDPPVAAEPAPLTTEELNDLKKRAEKADENWERLLRTTADLENFKKRAAREKQDAVKYGNESILQSLIPVLDTFDMALTAAQNPAEASGQSLRTGIEMVYQQMRKALADAGLEDVEAAGKQFDPNLHEAISQRETADVPEGQVVQQLRRGYKLRDRLLRPASVIVARHPAA